MTQRLAAGIDIGGTNTVFGLIGENGKILDSSSVKTTDYSDPFELTQVVSQKLLSMVPAGYRLEGAGIGAPNGNFYTGNIEFAPNLKWKGIVPLATYFSEALHCKAILTNDANAAALGEMIFGGARGMKNFLFITLGTGLGSGIVVNGEIVYGHDGFAGEVGHVITIPGGRLCGCGRRGCVEMYCSATGIKKTYLEKKNSSDPDNKINSQAIFEKAKEGEKEAIEAFEYTGEILGMILANSVLYTSPEAIFLFGGLAQSGDLIFDPTRKSFEENLLNIYKGKIELLPSRLKENDAALLGAASLIWKDLARAEII
ncbi:MAG: ROK family protein [Bacteroidia bacterium]